MPKICLAKASTVASGGYGEAVVPGSFVGPSDCHLARGRPHSVTAPVGLHTLCEGAAVRPAEPQPDEKKNNRARVVAEDGFAGPATHGAGAVIAVGRQPQIVVLASPAT